VQPNTTSAAPLPSWGAEISVGEPALLEPAFNQLRLQQVVLENQAELLLAGPRQQMPEQQTR